jgi:Ferritin-like domain
MASNREELPSTSELTLGELDRDGAIREAGERVSGETRATFFEKAVVGGAALLGAALAAPAASGATAKSDVAILNYALTLEYLQAAFYTETERLGAVGGELKGVPPQLGAVERAHVTAIKAALGHAAVKRPAFDFRGVTEDQTKFLKTAVAFEDLGAAAYKAQAARIKSPALLAAAISIHSVEARHAAWMRFLAGVTPAATAFDQGKSIREVKAIVASTRFIVRHPKKTSTKNPHFTG